MAKMGRNTTTETARKEYCWHWNLESFRDFRELDLYFSALYISLLFPSLMLIVSLVKSALLAPYLNSMVSLFWLMAKLLRDDLMTVWVSE